MTLSVPGTVAGIREAVDALDAWSAREHLPDEARRKLLTAFDEILSNVVRHALRGRSGLIEIAISRDGELVHAEVTDDAEPFDPLGVPAPDTSAGLEERRLGGLGIALVRAFTDEVRYERQSDRNRLTMKWRV